MPAMFQGSALAAQQKTGLEGQWVLSRERSEFPRELGFGLKIPETVGGASSAPAGRFPARIESADDGQRRDRLTEEVRNPPVALTIVESSSSVSITDDQGRTRTFH